MDFEKQVKDAVNAKIDFDHERVKQNIRIAIFENKSVQKKKLSKKMIPVFGSIGFAFVIYTGVTFAAGENPFSVIVSFVHNIGNDHAFGSGYSFEGGLYPYETAGKSVTFDHYGDNLDQFIGLTNYPRLDVDGVILNSMGVALVNKEKQLFYITAAGHTVDGEINLNVYHNAKSAINFSGQTNGNDTQKDVDLSGSIGRYIEFNNSNTRGRISYVAWKKASWTLVVNSQSISGDDLVNIAQKINNTVIQNQ
jgi:hypothetical protein